jgi:hypothetical protein
MQVGYILVGGALNTNFSLKFAPLFILLPVKNTIFYDLHRKKHHFLCFNP